MCLWFVLLPSQRRRLTNKARRSAWPGHGGGERALGHLAGLVGGEVEGEGNISERKLQQLREKAASVGQARVINGSSY